MLFDLRYFQVLGGTVVLFSGFTDQEKTLLTHELQAFGGSPAIADGTLMCAATHVVAKLYTQKVMMLMSMLYSITSVIEFYSIDQPMLLRTHITHISTLKLLAVCRLIKH